METQETEEIGPDDVEDLRWRGRTGSEVNFVYKGYMYESIFARQLGFGKYECRVEDKADSNTILILYFNFTDAASPNW